MPLEPSKEDKYCTTIEALESLNKDEHKVIQELKRKLVLKFDMKLDSERTLYAHTKDHYRLYPTIV